jgi:hypothetical protein
MKYLFAAIVLLTPVVTFGQSATIKKIVRSPSSQFSTDVTDTIKYPIIVTGNKIVEERINRQIRYGFFLPDDTSLSTEADLDNFIQTGLIYMDYRATMNEKGFLSLTIRATACGIYCAGWETYFNFDLNNGDILTIDDFIQSDTADFRQKVLKNKIKDLENYKVQAAKDFNDSPDDSADFEIAKQLVDERCIKSVSLNDFRLNPTSLEILDKCDFPHFIQNMQPDYELVYSYISIEKYLNKEMFKKLTNH